MTALFRGLLAGLLMIGLAVLGNAPGGASAQDKKDTKVEPKKVDLKAPVVPDLRDKSQGFGTSDGLTLNGYWFQGVALEKQRPDAVMMFPAPGNKVTDAWITLANDLSKNNFSVLLFDWRGCGMNDPATAGSRIFENKVKFWDEPYNKMLLMGSRATVEDKGLDYKTISPKSQGTYRYRDFLPNDLLAARFYLDTKSDEGKCNTNRVWIVTERDGAQLALAFIASEFQRNTTYDAKKNVGDIAREFSPAGKDYAGLTAMSYAAGNPTAAAIWKNALSTGGLQTQKEARDHLQHRLAMVMVYGKKEGQSGSKSAIGLTGVGGSDEDLKKNFKYLREVDNSKQAKLVTGIDLIDPMDSFGVKDLIVKAMSEISKDKQNFGKTPTDREANKIKTVPRFNAEVMTRR